MSDDDISALWAQHSVRIGERAIQFDEFAFARAVERAARAAAFDEAIAAIKAMPFGFAETIGPVMCIAAIEELRARAEREA